MARKSRSHAGPPQPPEKNPGCHHSECSSPKQLTTALCPAANPFEDCLANLGAIVERLANVINLPNRSQSRLQGRCLTSAHKPIGLSFSGPDQDRTLVACKATLRATWPAKGRRLLRETAPQFA